jgi:hypothetical protein
VPTSLVSHVKIFLILAAQNTKELAGLCYSAICTCFMQRETSLHPLITQQLPEIVQSGHSKEPNQMVQHFLVMENASCSISADWQKLTQILNLHTKLA